MNKKTFLETYDLGNILFLTITPLIALIGIPIYIHYNGFHWGDAAILFVFYWLTGLSITMGYHRLFAHKAYEASPFTRLFLLCFGAAAFQNSVYKWASDHRIHHQHVDKEKDPYNAKKGFWHSHIFWIFKKEEGEHNYDNVKDLAKDPMIMWQNRHITGLAFAFGWLLPLLIGFLVGRPFGFFLWGGVLRLVLVHHGTFFINSLAHIVGKQTYDDQTTARDSWWIAFFSFGEGFHNFHHRFPRDYRNGVRWYNWDPSKWLIKMCEGLGMSSNLRRYPESLILSERLKMDMKRLKNNLPAERWQKIQFDMEKARVSVEKTLEEWKLALGQYAQWKEKVPVRAKEIRHEFKGRIKEQKQLFQAALKEWNESVQFYLSAPNLTMA